MFKLYMFDILYNRNLIPLGTRDRIEPLKQKCGRACVGRMDITTPDEDKLKQPFARPVEINLRSDL